MGAFLIKPISKYLYSLPRKSRGTHLLLYYETGLWGRKKENFSQTWTFRLILRVIIRTEETQLSPNAGTSHLWDFPKPRHLWVDPLAATPL